MRGEEVAIEGVGVFRPEAHRDERGELTEVFRVDWLGEDGRPPMQANLSVSRKGVLRGLHYHRMQSDYWVVVCGRLRAGLADLRRGSPTEGAGMCVDLSDRRPSGLYIPPGVAHGYYALTDVSLVYLVDELYTGRDEQGVAWDDPELGLDWCIGRAPVLSTRDESNPRWAQLADGERPVFEK